MIYDIILVLIFLVLIIVNVYRGAARSLAGIIVSIISYLAATSLGKILSSLIYDKMLRGAVDNAVTKALSNLGTDAVAKFNENAPSWITGILKSSGIDLSSIISNNVNATSGNVSNALNQAIRPMAVNMLAFILTIVLFILICLLLRFIIVKPLLRVFRLPIINGLNRLLGGVIGFVDAFLIVSLLGYLLKLLLPTFESNSGIFNESTIYNSFIFYHFYSGNIFTAILSWIGL